jgi:methionine biosynthesis protein MetW
MVITEAQAYYETYWSDDGFCPNGRTWPELLGLMQRYTRPNAQCLDVGCGDGRTVGVWLRDNHRQYVGVDISVNALREASKQGLAVVKMNDTGKLPFQDSSIDVAFAIEVFEHLFAPQLIAQEILRVLRPGGTLIATVPNIAYWRRRLDLALFGRWNPLGDDLSVLRPWRDPHIRFFSPRTLDRMLRQAGFADIEAAAHDGGLLCEIPVLRRLSRGRGSSTYQWVQMRFPALLGYRVHAIAWKAE